MLLRKMLLKGIVFALMSVSLAANAAPAKLHTDNYTNEDSTVRITSNATRACAGSFGQYTPKRSSETQPGTSDVTWTQVKMLCMGSGDKCKADIYMTKDCSGKVVAKSELILATGDASIVEGTVDPDYRIEAKGANVLLAYAKAH